MEKTIRLERELAYTGTILKVYRDTVVANGIQETYDYIHHDGAAAVLPVTKEGKLLMVRQYRNALDRFTLELPAGKVDAPDEPRIECAYRELEEETGLTADSFRYLGPLLASPGFSDEVIHLYLAQGLHQGPCHPDPDEFLEFCRIPFAELLEQAMDGRLQDAKTVAGLLKTKVLLGL